MHKWKKFTAIYDEKKDYKSAIGNSYNPDSTSNVVA